MLGNDLEKRSEVDSFFLMALCVSLFLKGCSLENSSVDYEKIANKITARVGKKLEENKDFHLIGTGGAMMNDIQMMMMAFQYYQIVDIETARELLVYSVEEYLSAINSNEEIRPYLHHYPFTSENIKIDLYFLKPDCSSVPFGEINIAAASRGELIYYTESSPISPLHRKHKETYQDALKAISCSQESKIEVE